MQHFTEDVEVFKALHESMSSERVFKQESDLVLPFVSIKLSQFDHNTRSSVDSDNSLELLSHMRWMWSLSKRRPEQTRMNSYVT